MDKVNTKSGSKNVIRIVVSISIAIIVLVSIFIITFLHNSSKTTYGKDLLKNITANKVPTVETIPNNFISATTDFSINLFKQCNSTTNNSLISPTSVALALGMTANGAKGKTLDQLNNLLGQSKFSIDQLNSYYHTMSSILQSDKTNKIYLANSIWYRKDKSLIVNPNFLQINTDFYKSAAYEADFDSPKTIDAINNWVNCNTNGLIDSIVEHIEPSSQLLLIDTVLFDAEWQDIFISTNVRKGNFTKTSGSIVEVDFMSSFGEIYIKSSNAQGFIKPYKNSKYSFAAILPNEGILLSEYIKALNGESFLSLINSSKSNETTTICLPKFKYEYDISLIKPLQNLGFSEGFNPDKADFSQMATSSYGNFYIGNILHKTFIQVEEYGTKAGAVTKVDSVSGGMGSMAKLVDLNRPFVYAIIENETNLPLFIGTVMDPTK